MPYSTSERKKKNTDNFSHEKPKKAATLPRKLGPVCTAVNSLRDKDGVDFNTVKNLCIHDSFSEI